MAVDIVRLRLTPAAQRDLKGIWNYTADAWSISRADSYIDELNAKFELLRLHPELAPEWSDGRPPVRVYASGSHVVIYRVEDDEVAVVRVLHARQDWLSILQTLGV